MTVVEQLMTIREELCDYACKYKEEIEIATDDDIVRRIELQKFCKECPIASIHYKGV